MITLNEVRFEMNSEDSSQGSEFKIWWKQRNNAMGWGEEFWNSEIWWFVSCGYFLNIASSQSYEWLIMKNYKSQIKDDF